MKDYMKQVSVDDAIKAGRNDTICWDCQKAMNGGCCWTDPKQQKPVNGWTAEETDAGYRVIDCPEFKRGTYGGGMYRTADDYILALEIKVTDLKHKIENLKKTLWWTHVHRLMCQKRELQLRIKKLGDKLEAMEKEAKKNGEQEG